MLDKHGNKIEIGDTVKFLYSPKDFCKKGVVTEVGYCNGVPYYTVGNWSNNIDNGIPYYFNGYVEIIKKANDNMQEEPEVFTAEDQEQLDKLLKKQDKYVADKTASLDKVIKLTSKFYDNEDTLCSFMIHNIDEICATLQAYKKYHLN